jgi:hypothetical protein
MPKYNHFSSISNEITNAYLLTGTFYALKPPEQSTPVISHSIMPNRFHSVFACLLAVFSLAAGARAQSLAPAAWSGQLYLSSFGDPTSPVQSQITGPGSVSSVLDGNQGQFTGYAGFSPSLSVSVSATGVFQVSDLATQPALSGATGNATLTYSFEILGPAPSVQLEVISSGSASLSQAQSLWAEPSTSASFGVYSYNGGQSSEILGDSATANASITGNVSNSFSFNEVDQFNTGTVYGVSLSVYALAGIDDGTQTSSASVDPTFQIVGVPDPNDYSIVYSPGIGNSNSVPDVASTLALLSFSLVGLACLRRMTASSGAANIGRT